MKLIVADKVNKYYTQGEERNHILKALSLVVNEGDFLGIIGPSGSGKTTLLYCLSSLETIDDGDLIVLGEKINQYTDKQIAKLRQETFGFIFQFYHLIPNLTAYENIMLASVIAKKVDEAKIMDLLDKVGMTEYKDYFPNELSGGMQQRIAIARALVNSPKVLFADEPTGNLDQQKGKEIMELLKKLNDEEQVTIILVTHNEDYLSYCKQTKTLIDGEFVDTK
ncbi:MAG: ABC transporter ATP-binding protein [Acholeplasmataceae bacterium]|nr:ABC transporter ATP-binding protein [Acholeplasmataceae bacterium]